MGDGTRATIPIFPLASVVLFPKLRVPLYIFEPRYRQMTRHVLDGDRRVGMVTVRPEQIQQTMGNPEVFSTGCLGEIIHSESLPDGAYNIVLLGTHRFKIHAEDLPEAERLYRIAHVELLTEAPTRDLTPGEVGDEEAHAAPTRTAIVELLRELLQHARPGSPASELTREHFEGYDDELFVNTLAQSLSFSASEKQGLIESDCVRDRLEQLLALLQFRLAEVRSGAAGATSLQ